MSSPDSIYFNNISLSCTVLWNKLSNTLRFRVSVPGSLSKMVMQDLIGVPDNGHPISMDLVKLPETTMTKDWFGSMKSVEDWKALEGKNINIEGSFIIYSSGCDYESGNLIYKFHAECEDGTAYF